MESLDILDQGTFTTWIVPEPDDILTVGWGQALAKSLGRLLRVGVGTTLGNSSGVGTFRGQPNYQKVPIVKVWRMDVQSNGSIWYTDQDIMGSHCAQNPSWDCVHSLYFHSPDPTTGSARYQLRFDPSMGVSYQYLNYIVLAQGR